jgi:hypothetical protein
MIFPGVYIRKDLDFLLKELSGNPGGLTPRRENPAPSSGSTETCEGISLILREHRDGWCRMTAAGHEKGISLILDFLTGHQSIGEVLVWDFNHEEKEYSYSFFRHGKLLEQFSVRGPVLDAVSFMSELRKVELKDLINGFDFARESIKGFGLTEEPPETEGRSIRLDFSLPPKRTFWRSLLGSLAGDE